MSDIERVKEMVAEGRITADEGNQLIKVLMEVDDADDAAIDAAYEAAIEAADQAETLAVQEAEVGPSVSEPARQGANQEAATHFEAHVNAAAAAAGAAGERGREAARMAREAAHQTARDVRESARVARDAAREAARGAREAARGARDAARELRHGVGNPGAKQSGPRPGAAIAPPGTKWVTVEMIAGDLDVWAVDGLTGPEVEGGPGNINVEDTPDGYAVKFAPDRGGALDRFLSHVRSGSLRVRVPPEFGVVVKATAGDVDLHGVRYLRGNLTAGDLSADALEGIDFSSMAGDLEVSLRLTGGHHVLTMGAGDLEVMLDDRSDVRVDASVSIGDVSSEAHGFSHSRRTVGGEMTGQLGSGEGRLEL
ncbi:MAG TPA: hypothetical protein VFN03_05215, partial [Trueperaceae bacterium]|nr:hypothetical protein [Trueperaceae bacterium]